MGLEDKDYILREILPEEFKILKAEESRIASQCSYGNPPAVLKYNPSRQAAAFFREDGKGQLELIFDDGDLDKEQKNFIEQVYKGLEKRLEYLRMSKEEWVENPEDIEGFSPKKSDEQAEDDSNNRKSDDIPF